MATKKIAAKKNGRQKEWVGIFKLYQFHRFKSFFGQFTISDFSRSYLPIIPSLVNGLILDKYNKHFLSINPSIQ